MPMQFYRRLNPIKAISFDLDDTLYDNKPIIIAAELAQFDYIKKHVSQAETTTCQQWVEYRFDLLKKQPQLRHDMTLLRSHAIEQQLLSLGVNQVDAKRHSLKAFDAFYQQRNQIVVAPSVLDTLAGLANKYPLIAITNGNADIHAFGLDKYFEFALLSGQNGMAQKPSRQMFDIGCDKLGIKTQNLLHIGDSLYSDVGGAINANAMAGWINDVQAPLTNKSSLPHFEFSTIEQLSDF